MTDTALEMDFDEALEDALGGAFEAKAALRRMYHDALADAARYRADALAAEAEVARLHDEKVEAWFAYDRQQSRADRMAGRAADLEAQLAALPHACPHCGKAL